MWVVDRDSLQFLAVNQAAVERYGYTREEMLGMTVLQIRRREDEAHVRRELAEDRQQTLRGKLARHVTRSGEELRWRSAPTTSSMRAGARVSSSPTT